jgi:integrase
LGQNTKAVRWALFRVVIKTEYPSMVAYVGTFKSRYKETEHDYLTSKEISLLKANQFLKTTLDVGFRPCQSDTLKACLFIAYTGLRYSDILNLKWSNLSEGYVEFIQEKTGTKNRIPLHRDVWDVIPERKGKSNDAYVFNLPYSTPTIYQHIAKWLAFNGIDKKIEVHSFRRSFAQNLHDNGVSLEIIRQLMGHSSIENTRKYIRINSDSLVEGIYNLKY